MRRFMTTAVRPRYDPSSTISCSIVTSGRLTLTRVSREEEVDRVFAFLRIGLGSSWATADR